MKIKMAAKAIRSMLFSVMLLVPLQMNIGFSTDANENSTNSEAIAYDNEVPPSAQPKVVLLDVKEDYCDTECYLKKNSQTVEFMAKTFGIDVSNIYDDLIKKNENTQYDEYNIGLMKDKNGDLIQYSSFEKGLVEYLFDFTKKNPALVSNAKTPYRGEAEYVVNLIKYFTSIYENVDYLTAVSIGAAESGYYRVKYMLESNNVYGGMTTNHTLIQYKNIEYGVLSYIRLLSHSYYGKGLTDLDSIGRVYCPVYNESGQKIASPHWKNLVTTAKTKYANTDNQITIKQMVKY